MGLGVSTLPEITANSSPGREGEKSPTHRSKGGFISRATRIPPISPPARLNMRMVFVRDEDKGQVAKNPRPFASLPASMPTPPRISGVVGEKLSLADLMGRKDPNDRMVRGMRTFSDYNSRGKPDGGRSFG